MKKILVTGLATGLFMIGIINSGQAAVDFDCDNDVDGVDLSNFINSCNFSDQNLNNFALLFGCSEDCQSSWHTLGFKATYIRYYENEHDSAWIVTIKNIGSYDIDGKTYYELEVSNYDNDGATESSFVDECYIANVEKEKIGSYYYEIEDDEINRCVYEGVETITVPFGTFNAIKRTCWGTDYIEGLEPEYHYFPDDQKWIDWFSNDYFAIKEVDYWVDDEVYSPPVVQELTNVIME